MGQSRGELPLFLLINRGRENETRGRIFGAENRTEQGGKKKKKKIEKGGTI
jgi:hypothetical protein